MKPTSDSRPRIPAATPRTEEVRERMSVIVCSWLASCAQAWQGTHSITFVLWMTFSPTTGLIRSSRSSDIDILDLFGGRCVLAVGSSAVGGWIWRVWKSRLGRRITTISKLQSFTGLLLGATTTQHNGSRR